MKQENDSSIIWKATSLHHPTFGLHYPDSSMLKNDYLTKLKSNNYDVYFNGHEHLLNHAAIPLGEVEE